MTMDVTILGEWWESVRALPDADRLAWFDGIFRYANGGELPAAGDVWGNIGLGMARRMIDERARKSKAGRCGGRGHKADGKAENKADGKAETEEAKADGKHKERKIDRKIDRSATRGARAVPFDTVKSWADTHFCPPPDGDFLRMWHARMTESGWIDSRGHDLIARGTWQRELSVWWNREKEKKSAARAASASVADGGMMIGANGLPLRCGAEPDLV